VSGYVVCRYVIRYLCLSTILRLMIKVWNTVEQKYVSQNKYTGREIQTKDFPAVLASFFHDGEKVLTYHIPLILQKLSALARIISRLQGFRFYGCSLLFIYDGEKEIQGEYERTALEAQAASQSAEATELMSRMRARSEEREGSRKEIRRSRSEDMLFDSSTRRHISGKEVKKRGEVIIRVVDFAHTTTGNDYLVHPPDHVETEAEREILKSGKGYDAEVDPDTGLIFARFPPHHPELPDMGFLFGLKNLYESLETIYEEERGRKMKRSPASRDASSISSSGSSNRLSVPLSPSPSLSGDNTDDYLYPLPPEPKEIFSTIFPESDFGMLSS
jgi:inositol-hexakisphosphate 5-kinase